jgi:pimeloyl-ACP methyl ester carboxylesterase
MFNAANGPPYTDDWLACYRAAQLARNRRITTWARQTLEKVDRPSQDVAFTVHRTAADPRTLDLRLDSSDRRPGTQFGPPREVNYAAAYWGRHTTLQTWLNFWSYDATHLDGPRHLARVRCPVLVATYSADQAAFPSDLQAYVDAAPPGRARHVVIQGATHFMEGQPDKVRELADLISSWLHQITE